ncbi:WSC-domain-containing protein [Teratosphaeria nubilosa]|uniref:WSC-domain-containing protein n=1 Tax=Teratosphaeria nubilosa TaxID=161662 RepID=A0A6G1L2X7_9PEZI|nr:WSC-domain-containing protein [Teratosphaeria nubilosa]
MKHDNMLPFRRAILGLLALPGFARALTQEYCSSENTGSSYSAVHNIYQSNGACYDQCSGYAFAIVQYQDCWCSNYAPADQQSVSDCDENCPGYPSDKCGNKDQGLYGYIALPNSPSGTQGGSSSSPSSTSETASTYTQPVSISSDPPSSVTSPRASTTVSSSSILSFSSSTAQSVSFVSSSTTSTSQTSVLTYVQTSTESSTQQSSTYSTPHNTPTTSFSSSSTSQTPTSTSSSSSSSTSSTSSTSSSTTAAAVVVPVATTPVSSSSLTHSTSPSPVTSVEVVTVSGAVVTQTVTSTPSLAPDDATNSFTAQRKGLSRGATAGAVIGSLLGVAALAFGAFLLWRTRQRGHDRERAGSGPLSRSPRRNTSVLSKTGLLSRGRPASMTEREIDEPIYVNTATGNNSIRQSMLFGSSTGTEGVSPVSPLGANQDTENRRHSKPMVYDQRLNPSALFANHDNGSRVSMQDNNDYSRPLGVTNPDPRASFESRTSRA